MSQPVVFSVIESPMHPQLSSLYKEKNMDEIRINSIRKAISQLKKTPPDYVVAEFFYGYGNNYAGVNISNLDVLLSSMQKYAPAAKIIVIVEKSERQYVDKLNELFPLHAVLQHPVSVSDVKQIL